MTELKRITEENFIDAFNLNLAPGQESFVSHPVRSLAQAYVYRNQCQPFGIYADDIMVGYVMVIYDYDIPEYDIWHMMIDESKQGQGYGSAALDRVIDYIRTKPFGPSDRVTLTCNKDNARAIKLCKNRDFTETGEVLETVSVRGEQTVDDPPEAPEKQGYVFTGWKEKSSGEDIDEYIVRDDVYFIPQYTSESDIIRPTQIFLHVYEDWAGYSANQGEDDPQNYFIDDPFLMPEGAHKGKITWTSSDESILTFDSPGVAILKGTGDVDITATLENGLSATLRVHVYDSDKVKAVYPESMKFETEYTIGVGETTQILPVFQPQGTGTPIKNLGCVYESSDESVVKINDFSGGVFTGLKPGSAIITVKASDALDDTISIQSTFRINVTDNSGEQTQPEKPASINEAKVVLSEEAFTYNGKIQKPVIRSINGNSLTEETDYTINWSDPSSKNVGEYIMIVTGKGKYTGTAKASYKINPKGTKIKKPKKGKGSVKVKWKKQTAKMSSSRITGYQVQLATDKKFTENKKTLSVKGYRRASKWVSGLKGGRKYYIHVRTYKTIKRKTIIFALVRDQNRKNRKIG